MMKTNNKKLCATLLCVLVLVVFITSATYAWLSIEGSKDVDASFGDFNVAVDVKNDDTNGVLVEGLYKVNGLSQGDYEAIKDSISAEGELKTYYEDLAKYPYIDTLKVSVKVTSEIAGYMRVKILDEWQVTRDYINFDKVSQEAIFRATDEDSFMFNLGDGWVYDPVTKYCYYSKLINKGEETFSFIEGGSFYTPKVSSYFIETCEVTLALEVEVVQANRFEALWGIEEIPQPKEVTGNA